jgi:hypothetical protein
MPNTLLPYVLQSSRYTNKSDTTRTFQVSVHLGLLILFNNLLLFHEHG